MLADVTNHGRQYNLGVPGSNPQIPPGAIEPGIEPGGSLKLNRIGVPPA